MSNRIGALVHKQQARIAALEAENERLRADMLAIATLAGIVYQADYHDDKPGPTPAILRRIADLVRREQGGRP